MKTLGNLTLSSTAYHWKEQLEKQLAANRHRSVVLLVGDIHWAKQWLSQAEPQWHSWAENHNNNDTFSEQVDVLGSITSKTYRHHLGSEKQKIAFFDNNFNVDAFASLSGTLTAGGIFYIWLSNQLIQSSVFVQHLLETAKKNSGIYSINKHDVYLPPITHSSTHQSANKSDAFCLPTKDQHEAIANILKLTNSRANHALILTADRGRGKTTALALATVQYLTQTQQPTSVIITAPHRMAVTIFFEHITKQNSSVKYQNNLITWPPHNIQFVPVDQLIKEPREAHLLLVDEAAGIPVYLLEQLTRRYNRIVFSSTIHGYEGAGKGFTTKFLPLLQQRKKHVLQHHLVQPIRWNQNDPLEQFMFASCLLDAQYNELSNILCCSKEILSKENIKVSICSGSQLVENTVLLTSIFAILVTAHYQTKPSDLKLLLDDDNIRIVMIQVNNHVVAVALLNQENEIKAALKPFVRSGERRVKGHLIAQSLAQQSLYFSALDFQYLRVMRIAVHPAFQRQGLGSLLLKHIKEFAIHGGVGFVATSFAASTKIVEFWHKNQFKPVKLGFNKDASSGEHSLIMLNPINNKSESFIQQVQHEFFTLFATWLQDEFNDLHYSLVLQILSMATTETVILSARDVEKISAFSHHVHLFSFARFSLAKWLLIALSKQPKPELKPLIAKCLMLHSDQMICSNFGFTGKKMLYQHLQQLVKHDKCLTVNASLPVGD